MDKYSKEDVTKLNQYKCILIKIINKYWDSRPGDACKRRLLKHQEARIWRMIHREFPDIVILDGHYND